VSLPPAPPPDGYISAADACRVLGISDRTLRRRVQAGEIDGEYVARPQGSVLYVRLPQAATEAAAGGEQAAIVAALLERLDSKDAALLAATERAARAEATAETLRERVTDLAQLAAERQAELEELRDRERRPWWKRLLRLS
jgi:hypothetical protein